MPSIAESIYSHLIFSNFVFIQCLAYSRHQTAKGPATWALVKSYKIYKTIYAYIYTICAFLEMQAIYRTANHIFTVLIL